MLTYTSLATEESLTPYGSDHIPFITAQIPAALTIEGADRSNTNVHTSNDIMEHINFDLALEILKMNIATTASFLGRFET